MANLAQAQVLYPCANCSRSSDVIISRATKDLPVSDGHCDHSDLHACHVSAALLQLKGSFTFETGKFLACSMKKVAGTECRTQKCE